MDFSQQLPIVIHSLNIGFLQTLRLFVITLIGACPLGLAICFGSMSRIKPVSAFFETSDLGCPRYPSDDPVTDHLLFPGTGIT